MSYTPPAGNEVDFTLDSYLEPSGDSVNFELALITAFPFFIGLGVSGRIGKVGDADPLGVNGIYQMRMTKRGKRPIKMKFYTPTNPQSVLQEANRAKFAAAMADWQSLSSGDKAVYNERAKKRNMFGWGLFIREYYQNS